MVLSKGEPHTCFGIEAAINRFTAVKLASDGEIVAAENAEIAAADNSIPQMIEFINSLKDKFGPFSTLGIAVPGLIRHNTNSVAYSKHLPEHAESDLVFEIKAATGVDCHIENDANSAAWGEYKLGAGRGIADLFYVTLGFGIGGAFIIDGNLWRGASGFAGEFGYVPINSDGMRLEDVASAANIVERTRSRIHQDSTSSLSRIDEQAINISDIINAADQGDDLARMMLERTGEYIGTALASVVNLLNIKRIVFGGQIMDPPHLVLDSVIRRAKELSFGPSFENTEIVAGELGENAAAAGAALLSDSK